MYFIKTSLGTETINSVTFIAKDLEQSTYTSSSFCVVVTVLCFNHPILLNNF